VIALCCAVDGEEEDSRAGETKKTSSPRAELVLRVWGTGAEADAVPAIAFEVERTRMNHFRSETTASPLQGGDRRKVATESFAKTPAARERNARGSRPPSEGALSSRRNPVAIRRDS